MSTEIPKYTINNGSAIDIEATSEDILSKGHAVHVHRLYENGHYSRAVEVLKILDLGPHTPIIGRGEKNIVESAFIGAYHTFDLAQQFDVRYSDIAEGVIGDIRPPLIGSSQFNRLFDDDTNLWISKKDDEIVAGLSSDQIRSKKPFQATAPDALTAIESLVRMYHFRRQSPPDIMNLPVTLFR